MEGEGAWSIIESDMSYQALYLKYRPQTFDEVAGQKPVVKTLKNALASGKIAHAYLFAGPRGTGKTSMARLFAKALNCEKGVGEQCNECDNCVSVSNGSHPDVIEIDAASNNGVDQIRDLIERIKYSPIKGRYKVYIIDEVHMMSTGAFNALLKTLEEPPANVKFILCTTEPHKVIATIVSRCQRFDFAKLTDEEIKAKLIEVLTLENITCSIEAVDAIVSLADGGMRDAYSILDQILAYSGKSLSEEDVLAIYGMASKAEKIDLIESLLGGDLPRVMGKIDAYALEGIDFRRLTSDLIAIFRDVLVYEKSGSSGLLRFLKEDEAVRIAKQIGIKRLIESIDMLVSAQNSYRFITDIRSLFELTLLKLCTVDESSVVPVEKVVEEPKPQKSPAKPASIDEEFVPPFAPKEPESKPEPKPEPIPEPVVEKAPEPIKEPEPVKEPEIPLEKIDKRSISHRKIALTGETYQLSHDDLLAIMANANKRERLDLIENWKRLDTIRDDEDLSALADLLFQGNPFCLSEDCLVLAYAHDHLRDKANVMANQKGIEEVVSILLGRKVFVYSVGPMERSQLIRLFGAGQHPAKGERKPNLPKVD